MDNKWKVRANAAWKQHYEEMFRRLPKRERRSIVRIKWLKHVAKNAQESRICA